MDKRLREAIGRLRSAGDEDLAAGRLCVQARPPLVRMAAFHGQQAVEKYLKAWLVALGEAEPQLTHNLGRVAELIRQHGGPELPGAPLAFLTEFAVGPRYGLGDLTPADAERAVAEAEQIAGLAARAIDELTGGEA